LTFRLQLKNAGIDTNVFQTFQDPVRDAVVVLSPRVDGVVPVGRRLRITGFGLLERSYYRRQGQERSTDFYGEGRADLDLGSLHLFGGGGGGRFTQRFSLDVDERLPRHEKRAHAGATLSLSRRLSVTGQAATEVLTFARGVFRLGGDVKEAMDRNTLTATGQVRFALTPRTSLVASADALEDRFFSQPVGMPRRRRSHRYLGGLEFGERAVVTGRVLAGVREFPGTLAEGSPPYRGPVLAADLAFSVRQRARLRLVGERDVLYASSLVDLGTVRYRNAFVFRRYLGEAALDLPLRLVGLLSAGFEEAQYLLPYPYPDAFLLADRLDHRWTAGIGLQRRFGSSVRAGGHISWARRASSIPYFSYEGLRYGLTAEIVP
jgi:hypothetical protein